MTAPPNKRLLTDGAARFARVPAGDRPIEDSRPQAENQQTPIGVPPVFVPVCTSPARRSIDSRRPIVRRDPASTFSDPAIRLMPLLLSFLLALGGVSLGCAPVLLPAQSEARAPGIARVTLESVQGKDFVFLVWNETPGPLTVDREAVRLITPHDERAWDAGWMRRLVVVPAGGMHDVKMRFDLSGLNQGEQVAFDFSSALIVGGRPTPVPRFVMRVGD
jgi:hypothetical protein